MNSVLIVIPARYGSTRLPGKPLIEVAGKPVVQHVWERCLAVDRPGVEVVVATDDERIVEVVRGFGGRAVMTSPEASCGTDRLAEIATAEGFAHGIYLNVQGDEPLIRSEDIASLIDVMGRGGVDVGTLYHALSPEEAVRDSSVKVVTARNGRCLYFSRSVIPFERNPGTGALRYKKHVGLYAFTPQVLRDWPSLPFGDLEGRESLEQLRLLEAGYQLSAAEIEPTGPGVDTPETLAEVRAILEGRPMPTACNPWADVRLLVLDVDGVMTDGRLAYTAEPELGKTFHARDGLGITMLQAAGVPVGILTGRVDAATQRRIKALGIPEALIVQGRHDKGTAIRELSERAGVPLQQMAYMGDDIIDVAALRIVGRPCAPADAHPVAKNAARWVSTAAAGAGAVRELSEQLLCAQGHGLALSEPDAFEALMARRKVVQ